MEEIPFPGSDPEEDAQYFAYLLMQVRELACGFDRQPQHESGKEVEGQMVSSSDVAYALSELFGELDQQMLASITVYSQQYILREKNREVYRARATIHSFRQHQLHVIQPDGSIWKGNLVAVAKLVEERGLAELSASQREGPGVPDEFRLTCGMASLLLNQDSLLAQVRRLPWNDLMVLLVQVRPSHPDYARWFRDQQATVQVTISKPDSERS